MLSKSPLIAASALLIAAAFAPTAEAVTPTDIMGSCPKVTKVDFRGSASPVGTTSQTFVDLVNGSVDFTQGGASPTCVFVRFSATVDPPAGSGMQLKVALDNGVQYAWPGILVWTSTDPGGASSRSFEFVLSAVIPGPHSIKVQWLSTNGAQVVMTARALSVAHR